MAATVPWTPAHVHRLFWRAGFGATPGEARKWAARGQDATIAFLIDGPTRELRGRGARIGGVPIDPLNEFGHDVAWWLDRMVRAYSPLREKLTLFWHDHFACREQTPLMLAQNDVFRRHALGDFRALLRDVTVDPAMQRFLSLAGSNRRRPNENFARELFELFTLGSDYTEDDIREASRALTGYRAPRDPETGLPRVVFEERRHDTGLKTIFGQRGRFRPNDVLELAVSHPVHAHFLVAKLWTYFVTAPLDDATRASLIRTYRSSGLQIKPVVAEILRHPALYRFLDAPDMVKCPAVYVAGFLRAVGRPVDRNWAPLMEDMGMRLFQPPSVAGWDWGTAWLSTNAMRARFEFAGQLVRRGPATPSPRTSPRRRDGHAAVAAALAATGQPFTTGRTRKILRQTVVAWGQPLRPKPGRTPSPPPPTYTRTEAESVQRALRHLLVSGPDAHLH